MLPGSEAAVLLKELGATVIRVVPPAKLQQGLPAHFLDPLGRGKRLLPLDLKSEKDRKRLECALAKSDILLLGLRTQGLAKLGLTLASLHKRHRRLIICSINGFNKAGPYADRAGHDLNYLALAGLLGHNRDATGRPVIPPVPFADMVGGAMSAVIVCLAALAARGKTKQGSVVEVCMTDQVARLLEFQKIDPLKLLEGSLPRYNVYKTADGGYVSLACLEPKFFLNFCEVVGHPEWQRWATTFDEPLEQELSALFLSMPLDHWRELGLKRDICLTPVI